ncbi:MAG: oxidoreductase [Paludibacteraceae bacterium]|nr:oxidoreductase [Paludibacteraceae bacterium]
MKTALIIGSTGLVGSALLNELLAHPAYSKVISFTRKPSGNTHPKLHEHCIDFNNIASYKDLIQGDDLYCAMGTTIKKAGSQAAFTLVDYTYPYQFATIAKSNGVKQFLLVSSIGANAQSKNFYLQTKGTIENDISLLGFETVVIFRPSLLLGKRTEFRFGEKIAMHISQLFSFLFVGKLRPYAPIHSHTVAKAMVSVAQQANTGVNIYASDAIKEV